MQFKDKHRLYTLNKENFAAIVYNTSISTYTFLQLQKVNLSEPSGLLN